MIYRLTNAIIIFAFGFVMGLLTGESSIVNVSGAVCDTDLNCAMRFGANGAPE